MSKTDEMLRRLGGNMAESLGARTTETAPAPILTATPGKYDGRTKLAGACELDIERITADPEQPRKEFDREGLESLAGTMRRRGVLQAIRVRWSDDLGKWVILCGERRYRAAQIAGLRTIPCILVEADVSPADRLADQLIENAHRVDLKPIEQANAFRKLMDEFGWSTQRLADELHLGKSTVSKSLALLRLPEDLREQVDAGEIPASTGYQLTKLETAEQQREAAAAITTEGLTRDEAAAVVQRKATGPKTSTGRVPKKSSRVFRVATGKVTVEIPKGRATAADYETALLAALEQLRGRAAA